MRKYAATEKQPRPSSASLNSAAGVAADTLILESASFASWPCDRCARIPWARDQMGTGAFPQQSDRRGQRVVMLFFLPFLPRRRTADTDKRRDGPRGGSGNGRWKIKILCFPRYETPSAVRGRFIHMKKRRGRLSSDAKLERDSLSLKDYTYDEIKTRAGQCFNAFSGASFKCESYNDITTHERKIVLFFLIISAFRKSELCYRYNIHLYCPHFSKKF